MGEDRTAAVLDAVELLTSDVVTGLGLQHLSPRGAHPRRARVHVYGSAAQGFAGEDSDVDLTIHVPFEDLRDVWRLVRGPREENTPRALAQAFLQALGTRCQSQSLLSFVEFVPGARVPVLTLRLGSVRCDVTVNNLLPLHNTQLLAAYVRGCGGLAGVARAVIAWARDAGVLGAPHGHLSAYPFCS